MCSERNTLHRKKGEKVYQNRDYSILFNCRQQKPILKNTKRRYFCYHVNYEVIPLFDLNNYFNVWDLLVDDFNRLKAFNLNWYWKYVYKYSINLAYWWYHFLCFIFPEIYEEQRRIFRSFARLYNKIKIAFLNQYL